MTREVEWDDESREELLALAEYEAGVCQCGFHASVTSDPENLIVPEITICPVCRAQAARHRELNARDEKARKAAVNMPSSQPRASDGRRLRFRLLSEAEATAKRERLAAAGDDGPSLAPKPVKSKEVRHGGPSRISQA